MLFLPDQLYDETRDLIHRLENNINRLLDLLREVLAAKQADPDNFDDAKYTRLVNEQLSEVNQDYSQGLEALRKKYQAISRDMMLR
jgi:hypothetical protein